MDNLDRIIKMEKKLAVLEYRVQEQQDAMKAIKQWTDETSEAIRKLTETVRHP